MPRDHNDRELRIDDVVTLRGIVTAVASVGEYHDELLTIDLGDGVSVHMLARKVEIYSFSKPE